MPFQSLVLADRVVEQVQGAEQPQGLGLALALEDAVDYRVAPGTEGGDLGVMELAVEVELVYAQQREAGPVRLP